MYAIIEACGKQYKVVEGDTVFFTVEANNINTLLKNNSLKDIPPMPL